MADGKVLHASHDGVHVLRYIGDIRYTLTPSINRFLEGVFAGPKPAGFVIDLTQADSIDSTNLGQLARIAMRMQELEAPRVTLVSNRTDINSVLASMALDEVFDIVEDTGPVAGAERELPQADADKETLARTLIDAHRALMELSEHNEEMFRDVVASLEKNRAGS
ncbi:MAG: STAS domain-containing protein [Gammaproteobacteria bacterium]|jgi:anti-anti-sigma factor